MMAAITNSRQHFTISLQQQALYLPIRMMLRLGMAEPVMRLSAADDEKRNAAFFAGYTPTERDVIVATYARSGTHWMLQTTLQIAHRGQAEFDYIYDHVAWPDYFPQAVLGLHEPAPPSPTGLRIIKTHLQQKYVPVNDKARYISVIRDPKDVLVSYYHFLPQALAFMGWRQISVERFYPLALNVFVHAWAKHTASWWAQREKPNVMVIPFHDLKANHETYVQQIASLVGVDLSDEELANVIEKSSFDYMKHINHRFSPIPKNTEVVDIVRAGKTGSGKNLFTSQQLDEIEFEAKRQLRKLGSDFPYNDIFR